MKRSCNLEAFTTQWFLSKCQEGSCSIHEGKNTSSRKQAIRACYEKRHPEATKEEVDKHENWCTLGNKCDNQ